MTNREKARESGGKLALGLTAVDVSARVLDFIEELFLSVNGELEYLANEVKLGRAWGDGGGGEGNGG